MSLIKETEKNIEINYSLASRTESAYASSLYSFTRISNSSKTIYL